MAWRRGVGRRELSGAEGRTGYSPGTSRPVFGYVEVGQELSLRNTVV